MKTSIVKPESTRRSSAISSLAQVRALASPMRQEIVDALESAGPSSIARLAELLNRAPDTLYFHIRRLLKVGLVVESERNKEGRHVRAVYDVFARPLKLSYGPPVKPADIAKVIESAVRLGLRDFRRGMTGGESGRAAEGPSREIWGGRAKGWVTPAQLGRVNALLEELLRTVRSGEPSPGSRPVSVCFVLAPTPARRARAGSSSARAPDGYSRKKT